MKLTQEEAYNRFQDKGWELVDKYHNAHTKVKVKCPYCKEIKLIRPHSILNNNQKSCGCVGPKLGGEKNSKASKEKSLGYLYPEIVKLYSKNNEKSVFEINPGSEYKYLWICEKYGYEHEYKSTANNAIQGNRCPYCVGKKILEGFNDLASKNPELAGEWHPTKNELKSNQVTQHSNKKVWWKCSKCDYEWKTTINNRTNGCGCPNCRPISYGVEKIKKFLIEKNINFEVEKRFYTCKNKRQLPFDFYLPDNNILIEYNGEQHYRKDRRDNAKKNLKRRQKHDKIKKKWAKENGYHLLIIPYWEKNNIETILKQLEIIQQLTQRCIEYEKDMEIERLETLLNESVKSIQSLKEEIERLKNKKCAHQLAREFGESSS